MADFIDRAYLRSLSEDDSRAQAAFADLFAAIAELRSVHAKAYLNTENIESLFGAIEMGKLLGKLGDRTQEGINQLHKSIVFAIVRTLEWGMPFPVDKRTIQPAPPYGAFASVLNQLRDDPKLKHSTQFGIITFNYDIALEQAFVCEGIRYHYGLPSDTSSGGIPLLKLHGSLNWGVCAKCGQVVPYDVGSANFNLVHDQDRVFYDLGTKLFFAKHCGADLLPDPVIVPPAWNKTQYHSQLADVWRRAADLLRDAENVFVIGYSLPETDSFFRYLFALGSDSPKRLRRFWVFNPDTTTGVEQRYRDLTGRGIAQGFRYFPGDSGKFASALNDIYYAVAEQPPR